MRFRTPEIFLGCLLTVAVFSIGILFSSPYPVQTTRQPTQQTTEAKGSNTPQPHDEGGWAWITKDAAGFFTFLLVIVGGFQAYLFLRQLRIINESLIPAKEAADASLKQANAIISAERPYIVMKIIKPGVTTTKGGPFFFGEAFQFELFNYGKTPAILNELKKDWRFVRVSKDLPAPIDPMVDRDEIFETGTAIGANEAYSDGLKLKKTFAQLDKPDDTSDRCRLYFHGFVRYSDVFGNHYICGFMAAFKPGANRWLLRGGKQHNYMRQENPKDIPPIPAKNAALSGPVKE
jgi:hypothetical protein